MTFTEQELKTIKFALTRQFRRTRDANEQHQTEEGSEIEKELIDLINKMHNVHVE